MVNLEYVSDFFYDFYSLLQDCKSRGVLKKTFCVTFLHCVTQNVSRKSGSTCT